VSSAATAFGTASFAGRLIQSISPVVSSLEQPTPMLIYIAISIGAGFSVLLLRVPPQDEPTKEAKQPLE